MAVFTLVSHPDHPPRTVGSVFVRLDEYGVQTSIIYGLDVGSEVISLPPKMRSGRADGLWRTTCFELFVRGEEGSYLEFNFSPSGQWAAYSFEGYRAGMRPMQVDDHPLFTRAPDPWTEDLGEFVLFATLGQPPRGIPLALAAVIEETDGTKSYWALAHAPGPPDFHNPACFTATLPVSG